MIDLAPCSACRRHVRIDEATCPFCGAATAGAPRTLPVGRFARAAVFAGAVAGAATGCGGKSKPADPNIENESTATIDAGAPDAAPVSDQWNDEACCMPYGAPPARDRLV